ncbi:MAG: RNA methyltransferase [Bacteroidales bacterium]|nr:RNA methyltransferase [Bacteroidales bacterium]
MPRKLLNEELNRLTVNDFKESEKSNFVVILDNIRSMNNVGAVFRTSDAFMCEKIFLCGITPTPPHRDIQKTALGATETVDWEYVENTVDVIKKLKSEGFKIAAIEQVENAVMLNNFTPEKEQKYAFIFGNEVKGVEQEVVNQCDFCLEIPQFGTKHSLNISVSAGVVLWDFVNKGL